MPTISKRIQGRRCPRRRTQRAPRKERAPAPDARGRPLLILGVALRALRTSRCCGRGSWQTAAHCFCSPLPGATSRSLSNGEEVALRWGDGWEGDLRAFEDSWGSGCCGAQLCPSPPTPSSRGVCYASLPAPESWRLTLCLRRDATSDLSCVGLPVRVGSVSSRCVRFFVLRLTHRVTDPTLRFTFFRRIAHPVF